MPKIKVLFTIPNFDTAGSGKALLNIANRLDKEKFEAEILCRHDKGDFFEVVRKSGLKVHVFDYLSKPRPIASLLKNSRMVGKKLKTISPDIIHSFNYSSDYSEALAAKFAGIPWTFTKKNMSWGGKSANSWKLRSFLAKGIVLQNTDMKVQFYPRNNKTTLIPRGVEISKFSHKADYDQTSFDLSGSGKRKIILVANLVPVKGAEILLKSFSTLNHFHSEWELWIIGDDKSEYGKSLHQLCHDLSINTLVFFSGKKPEIRPYLDQAEIFVLPTKNEGRREGSPVAMLEAMANGKLVLGSDIPGIRDQLKPFREHIFEAGSVESLSETLKKFLSASKETNKATGHKFMEYVSENYSIELEVERHQKFYQKIVIHE